MHGKGNTQVRQLAGWHYGDEQCHTHFLLKKVFWGGDVKISFFQGSSFNGSDTHHERVKHFMVNTRSIPRLITGNVLQKLTQLEKCQKTRLHAFQGLQFFSTGKEKKS